MKKFLCWERLKWSHSVESGRLIIDELWPVYAAELRAYPENAKIGERLVTNLLSQ